MVVVISSVAGKTGELVVGFAVHRECQWMDEAMLVGTEEAGLAICE